MRISDWSSDVCSSDLFARRTGERDDGEDSDYRSGLRPDAGRTQGAEVGRTTGRDQGDRGGARPWGPVGKRRIPCGAGASEFHRRAHRRTERKSVVSGKSVSVRVDLVGRRLIKKIRVILLTH